MKKTKKDLVICFTRRICSKSIKSLYCRDLIVKIDENGANNI